jgi:hypothetical protein
VIKESVRSTSKPERADPPRLEIEPLVLEAGGREHGEVLIQPGEVRQVRVDLLDLRDRSGDFANRTRFSLRLCLFHSTVM